MSGLPMHRSSVKQVTIVYRVAAVVGAAAAFAVLSFGAPGLNDEPIVETPAPTQPGQRQAATQTEQGAAKVDEDQMTAIAIRFGMAEPEAEGSVATPAPSGQGDLREIQYLGSILSTTRRLAMLSLNGTQRVVREGQEIDDPSLGQIRLVAVEPQMIQIEQNGSVRRINKQSRSGAVLSVVQPASTNQPAGKIDPQNAKARRDRILREREGRLEEEQPSWRRPQVIEDENGIRTRSGDGGGTQTVPLTGSKPGASN